MIAKTIIELNQAIIRETKTTGIVSLVQTYSLNKDLKKFGKYSKDLAMSKMKQLHDCICFKSIQIEDMSIEEKKKAIETLIFMTEKKDSRLKSRTCARVVVNSKSGLLEKRIQAPP